MRNRIRERFRGDTELSQLPDHALLGIINIPGAIAASPWSLIGRRVLYAFLLLFVVAFIVYVDKDGKQQFQAARVVAVAGNSIESPRLLLNSASSMFPDLSLIHISQPPRPY